MTDSASRKFVEENFDTEKYVKELTEKCVGGLGLLQERQKVYGLQEETNAKLKKNVYENYMQFIETAKEISHLESEMYQLSHMLSEQRSLLSSLSEYSLLGNKAPVVDLDLEPKTVEDAEDEQRRKLASIIEKVEGCVSLLEVPGRTLLYDGDLLELDVNENTPKQRIHGYLLNDSLVLAVYVPNRRTMRYKFQVQYQLESLAVVNVRDLGNINNAFKFLAFPDTRLFQCPNLQSKRDWMDAFDKAKKSNRPQPKQQQLKRELSAEKAPLISGSGFSGACDAPAPEYINRMYFGLPLGNAGKPTVTVTAFEEPPAEPTPESLIPDWLCETPDDLDVFMAQRHFDDAYALIVKSQETWHQIPASPKLFDLQRKIDARIKTLTEKLMRELEVSPDRSLQGGLRAARRAVRLLNLLGCSTQACDLFLKLSSSILKTQLKRTKREGVSVLYITQFGRIFFNNLMDIAREFLKSFPNSPSCTSAFVVWVGVELQLFTSHLNKHVFIPQSSITTLAECVAAVRKQSEQLCELGLDLRYQLDGLLRAPLVRSLQDSREKLADSVKLRAQDDAWRQTNFLNKQGQTKFVQEMTDLGFKNINAYLYGDSWSHLTSNTIAFTKLYVGVLDKCLSLASPELEHTVSETLAYVLRCQLRHAETALTKYQSDPTVASYVTRNATFLITELLPLAENTYAGTLGHPSIHFQQLHKEFSKLIPAQKSVAKYTTVGYV